MIVPHDADLMVSLKACAHIWSPLDKFGVSIKSTIQSILSESTAHKREGSNENTMIVLKDNRLSSRVLIDVCLVIVI